MLDLLQELSLTLETMVTHIIIMYVVLCKKIIIFFVGAWVEDLCAGEAALPGPFHYYS